MRNNHKNWAKTYRIDTNFCEWGKEILKKRISINKEDPLKPNGMRRLTKALINLMMKDEVLRNQIEERMINSDWEEDRWKNE